LWDIIKYNKRLLEFKNKQWKKVLK
jgi:hypothetical protein